MRLTFGSAAGGVRSVVAAGEYALNTSTGTPATLRRMYDQYADAYASRVQISEYAVKLLVASLRRRHFSQRRGGHTTCPPRPVAMCSACLQCLMLQPASVPSFWQGGRGPTSAPPANQGALSGPPRHADGVQVHHWLNQRSSAR